MLGKINIKNIYKICKKNNKMNNKMNKNKEVEA